ncbi:hypothetical protein T484DRAFT_1917051 [Baffinella frigidus]|nr:hypothetical protein T484DRAFT_1917051 [Cryptophyta sp. CCMP2293]
MGVGCLLGVLPGLCCFMCNMQNKGIASRMKAFCDKVNAEGLLLPASVRMEYEFFTQPTISGPKKGATLESYHKLTFHTRGYLAHKKPPPS